MPERRQVEFLKYLGSCKLADPGLECSDRSNSTDLRIIVEIATLRSRESADTRWFKTITLIQHKVAELFAERRQHHINIELAELADRQEVGRGGLVGRPLIERRSPRWRARHIHAPIG